MADKKVCPECGNEVLDFCVHHECVDGIPQHIYSKLQKHEEFIKRLEAWLCQQKTTSKFKWLDEFERGVEYGRRVAYDDVLEEITKLKRELGLE